MKAHAADAARLEVELFDARIETLTSIHQERVDRIDWAKIRDAKAPKGPPPEPEAPPPINRYMSTACQQAVDEYTPGFFEKLFGLQGRLKRLQRAVEEAKADEDAQQERQAAEHVQAVEKWRQARAAWETAKEEWQDECELARRVLDGDNEAYGDVLKSLDIFEEIGRVIPKQTVGLTLGTTTATVEMRVSQDTVVPTEEKKLTARSDVSTKKMAATRRTEIYEDYVCGAALRSRASYSGRSHWSAWWSTSTRPCSTRGQVTSSPGRFCR